MKWHRFAHKCYSRNIPLLPGLIYRLSRIVFSCDIPASVEIGENTVFPHNGLGVVIHPNVVIGDNCRILQNVTIGGRGGVKNVPQIGNNVLIGAGACVLGDICIGNNVKIGANAVVLKDLPDSITVVGIPARPVAKG